MTRSVERGRPGRSCRARRRARLPCSLAAPGCAGKMPALHGETAWGCRGYFPPLGTPAVRSGSICNARFGDSNWSALRTTRGVTPRFTLTRAGNPTHSRTRRRALSWPWLRSRESEPVMDRGRDRTVGHREPSAAWHRGHRYPRAAGQTRTHERVKLSSLRHNLPSGLIVGHSLRSALTRGHRGTRWMNWSAPETSHGVTPQHRYPPNS